MNKIDPHMFDNFELSWTGKKAEKSFTENDEHYLEKANNHFSKKSFSTTLKEVENEFFEFDRSYFKMTVDMSCDEGCRLKWFMYHFVK